ncbi:MAG: hypothetical protein MUF87_16200 [Anaerolineae bacterium]|nr:hypothetical protein [Anaerolineae bacterium]
MIRIGLLVIAGVLTLGLVFGRIAERQPFIYALDDAYIHLSIARNFVEHGVWGTTRYEFTSSTSSPLWTGLIALTYPLLGEMAPLSLNLVFAGLLWIVITMIAIRCAIPALYLALALIAIIIVYQIERYVLIGMEHVLQVVVNIGFVYLAARGVIERPPLRSRLAALIFIFAILVTTARYEGAFLVLVFCLLFAVRLRLTFAIALGLISIAPLVFYGLIARAQGWEWLPSSIIINSNRAFFAQAGLVDLVGYFTLGTVEMILEDGVLYATLAGCCAALLFRWTRPIPDRVGEIMLIAVILLIPFHARLVNPEGTHLRYEAYLFPLAITAILVGLAPFFPTRWSPRVFLLTAMSLIVALVIGQPWLARLNVLNTHVDVTRSMINIYEQQYQMARFVARYYPGEGVGANDIGAINYFADIRNVDLWGLGTLAVIQARSTQTYSRERMDQIMRDRDAHIAIIYSHWFNDLVGGVPETWIPVGTWRVSQSAILGGDTVTFYALDPESATRLAQHLRDFDLPATVEVTLFP